MRMIQKMKNDFLTMIEQADTIAITGHVRPDGDCVGSTVGSSAIMISRYRSIWRNSPRIFSFYMMQIRSVIHRQIRSMICVLRWIVVIRKDREIFFQSLNMRSIQCVWIIISPIRDLVRYAMWMQKRVPRQKHFIS